jgi:formylglycine-generating enzyme required for sulfatase activity
VQARDIGTFTTADGRWMPYMVLEWLDGDSLETRLLEQRASGDARWSLSQMLAVLTPVAQALDVAHGRGVAHRDVKPSNVFLLKERSPTGSLVVKILDFGVAKLMADNTQMNAALAKTGVGITSFTPQYGAPEQFSRSHGATGPWTDVYALALVAVELLVGHPVLDGEDFVQLGYASANRESRPTPRALGAIVPDAVETVFQRALTIDPAERYERAGTFWRALAEAATVPNDDTVVAPSRPNSSDPSRADALGAVPARQPAAPPSAADLGPPSDALGSAARSPTPMGSPAGPFTGRVMGMVGGAIVVIAAVGGGLTWWLNASRRNDPNAMPAASHSVAPAASSAASAKPACPEDMALIPAGQFFMGSDQANALPNEKPSHNVKLDAFCIDLYEVTAAQYKACSDVGKCRRAARHVSWPGISENDKRVYAPLCNGQNPSKGDHPVNCVDWRMAKEYCRVRGRRLPTEAEWEYATRGPDGRVYPWGDEEPTARHLNACGTECAKWGELHGTVLKPLYEEDDGFATTAPVGKFKTGRSRFGPYDVAGNVWEWVADWYGEYSPEPQVNPHGPAKGEKRVIRGGAWNGSYATWLRPSFRYAQVPDALSHGIGFRCARALDTD